MTKRTIAINSRGNRVGEGHGRAVLSDASIDLIRELHEQHGKGYGWLSVCFEVSKSTIRLICKYRIRAQTPDGYKTGKKRGDLI